MELIRRIVKKLMLSPLIGVSSEQFHCGKLTWSQFGEDVIASGFFPAEMKGTYLDVGCFDPLFFSTTYLLYRSGWSGICVDANGQLASRWQRLRPRDKFINCFVGQDGEEVSFQIQEDPACSGASQSEEGNGGIQMRSRTIASLVAESGLDTVDLLSVDCEGFDLKVLEGFPWETLHPKVVLAEDQSHEWQTSKLTHFMNAMGYRLHSRAHITSVFLDNSHQR